MPKQLTLSFDPQQHHTRGDFLIGSANRAVVEALDRWPHWPAPALVLVGPEASGKSHLAAIFNKERGAQLEACDTINWHGLAAGLAERPSGSIVIVEDVEIGLDEAGLFHVINAITSARGCLLLTSRSLPSTWGVSLPDLASRLRAATPVVIGPPDDELLEAIMAKHFADRQTVVDPSVIRYSLSRMERTYAAALDLVTRLDRAALARKIPITQRLAAEILGERSDQMLLPGLEHRRAAVPGDD